MLKICATQQLSERGICGEGLWALNMQCTKYAILLNSVLEIFVVKIDVAKTFAIALHCSCNCMRFDFVSHRMFAFIFMSSEMGLLWFIAVELHLHYQLVLNDSLKALNSFLLHKCFLCLIRANFGKSNNISSGEHWNISSTCAHFTSTFGISCLELY